MILTWNISAEESNWRSGILEAWSNHWMGSMDSAPQHIEIPEHIVNANWWVLNNVLQSGPARDVAVAVAALVRALQHMNTEHMQQLINCQITVSRTPRKYPYVLSPSLEKFKFLASPRTYITSISCTLFSETVGFPVAPS